MLKIYGHPLASFYWKVAIAAYERSVPFEFEMVDTHNTANMAAVAIYSPTGQFPVLVDSGKVVIEFAAIIEYLDLHCGAAPPLVPADRREAIEERQMDSVFDDYVMAPLTRMVLNAIRNGASRDPLANNESQSTLDKSYRWLNNWMAKREWAANDSFSLADVAAGPALFYAHWGYAIPQDCVALRSYRSRLLARPSIAHVISEARPWFEYFPLKDRGSPD